MFANPIWYFVCIGVALVVALLLRAHFNKVIDDARKNGITDYGLGFDNSSNYGSDTQFSGIEHHWTTDPHKSYLDGNIYHRN